MKKHPRALLCGLFGRLVSSRFHKQCHGGYRAFSHGERRSTIGRCTPTLNKLPWLLCNCLQAWLNFWWMLLNCLQVQPKFQWTSTSLALILILTRTEYWDVAHYKRCTLQTANCTPCPCPSLHPCLCPSGLHAARCTILAKNLCVGVWLCVCTVAGKGGWCRGGGVTMQVFWNGGITWNGSSNHCRDKSIRRAPGP